MTFPPADFHFCIIFLNLHNKIMVFKHSTGLNLQVIVLQYNYIVSGIDVCRYLLQSHTLPSSQPSEPSQPSPSPSLTPVSANERPHCKVHPYLSQEWMERGGKERDTQKLKQTLTDSVMFRKSWIIILLQKGQRNLKPW